MQTIPKYLDIGSKRYKTKHKGEGLYSLFAFIDLCSLQYIGDWTQLQLIQAKEIGVLN